MKLEGYMNLDDAAAYAGVDPSTLRRAARLGTLKTERVGKKMRLTKKEHVDEWKSNPEHHKPGPKKK